MISREIPTVRTYGAYIELNDLTPEEQRLLNRLSGLSTNALRLIYKPETGHPATFGWKIRVDEVEKEYNESISTL